MRSTDVAELYRRIGKPAPKEFLDPKEHKYGARKKSLDGHIFDSTGEAEAYRYLKRDEALGQIAELKLQPRFLLQTCSHAITSDRIRAATKKGYRKARDVYYVPDFQFVDQAGDTHVVDFKGFQTQAYKIKRSLFRERYPDIIFEEWNTKKLKEMNR